MRTIATIPLHLAGPGFVVYSPYAMASVATGARYLDEHLTEPEDVAAAVRSGRLAACCTGSPGNYHVELYDRAPDVAMLARHTWWIRLAVEIRDRMLCVRDLFDFARWDAACPSTQRVEVPDGIYRLAVGTRPTTSGIVGDDQEIAIAFERAFALPALTWTGVPFLGAE